MVNIKKDAKHNIAVLSATTMVQVQSTKYKKNVSNLYFVFCQSVHSLWEYKNKVQNWSFC